MARHRKVGRPKGSKSKARYEPIGCSKVHVYRKHKGRIQKVNGFKHKACLT